MGIAITACAIASPSGPGPASTVDLASRAARSCLEQAGISPSGVGVLVNVGVYRENNTFEPALAAMIQKEVGINLDYLADPQPAAGFSFDLMDGASGVLSAVRVAQSLLTTSTTERVLVTAADVHPGGDAARDPHYPYADLGGAFLLERSPDPGSGFGPVRHYDDDRPTDVEGYLDLDAMGHDGRSSITVRHTPGHRERASLFTTRAVVSYMQEFGLDFERTLTVGPRPPSPAEPAEPHTAAPVLGFRRLLDGERPAGRDTVLFVATGAGPRTTCVSYRPQEW
ncbi:hypothetical protein ACIQWN_32475 [Streptomyces vinaceus]|uniref:hypothetical protein n=1 Tax=Streptomyces vinaceus TaxID=1960 RepID=UPI0038240D45